MVTVGVCTVQAVSRRTLISFVWMLAISSSCYFHVRDLRHHSVWFLVSQKPHHVAPFSQGSTTVILFFMVHLQNLTRFQRIQNSSARVVTNWASSSAFISFLHSLHQSSTNVTHLMLFICKHATISTALSVVNYQSPRNVRCQDRNIFTIYPTCIVLTL